VSKASASIVVAFALLASRVTGGTQPVQSPNDVWSTLQVRTAWLHLGDISVDGSRWVTAFADLYPEFTGSFRILDRAVDPRSTTLPEAGEWIEIQTKSRLLISNYRLTGEQYRLEPPGEQRRNSRNDETDVVLPVGAVVRVVRVWVSPACCIDGDEHAVRLAFALIVPE